MASLLFALAVVAAALGALSFVARSDLRRYGGVSLSALEEELRPRAAEHRKIEEHVAGEGDDDDGDGPR